MNGDAIYNGARDNASGIAAVLAVARAFATSLPKAPRRSILFVATTAEEPGLLGSEYFVGHSPVALESIVAAINLDGFTSFWPLRDVEGWGARHTSLGSALRKAAAQLRIEATIPEQDGAVMTLAGDQVAFATKGIPVVWLAPGKKTWDGIDTGALERRWRRYHQPDDDMSQPFDFGASAKAAQVAFLLGYIVLDEKARPTWRKGDFFGQAFAPARNP